MNIVERAKKVMPGGVSSPVRALTAVNGEPLFTSHATGPFLIDISGKRYIDLCMSFGPLILGHAHPDIVKAIQSAAARGTSYGTSTEFEVDLAEKIVKNTGVDWVRFVNSGTEALMSAIRLARGITHRDIIIKFEGCYHGHADSLLVKAGSGLSTFGISSSNGVPEGVSRDTIVLQLGDYDQLIRTFEQYGDKIAAVLIEGIPANNGLLIQDSKFMHEIQNNCNKYGAIFILDEVITGFRIGMGGAAEFYNLQPDIITYGKVIGGGLPVGAYGGKSEYMQYIAPLGNVYQAGTLSGNPLAMAAGNKMLDIIHDNDIYGKLEYLAKYFENGLTSEFNDNNIPLSYIRIGSIGWIVLENNQLPQTPKDIPKIAVDRFNTFHPLALQHGIYLPPSAYEVMFLSTAHTPEILDKVITTLASFGDYIE